MMVWTGAVSRARGYLLSTLLVLQGVFMHLGTLMPIAKSEVSIITAGRVFQASKLRLMWNEVPCGKPLKVRSDGRHSPSSTAKSGGDPKECRSVDCAQPEACWGTGSTSMNAQISLSLPQIITNVCPSETTTFTALQDQPLSGKRAMNLRNRRMSD